MGIVFYDSATEANLPSGEYVMLPADGSYQVTGPVSRFKAVRWYTNLGDYRRAGAIDWEPGNECFTPRHLRRFVRGRRGAQQRARVYCDRADAREAWEALTEGTDTQLRDYAEWWISTLDGGQPPTVQDLAAQLDGVYGAPIPAGKIWACQYKGGMTAAADESILYLDW